MISKMPSATWSSPSARRCRRWNKIKSDNVGLRNALAELRAGHESVRTEFSALEKRAAELESAGEELSRELALAQQAVRGLEGDKAELTSEIVAARAEVAISRANWRRRPPMAGP